MAGLRIYSDEERRERKREANKKYRESRSEEQKERERVLHRKWEASLSEEQRERRRAATRKWKASLSEEQKEYQRMVSRVWAGANLAKRRENRKPLTEAQKVAKRDYDSARWANLTDDERARIAVRVRARDQGERDSLSDAYVKHLLRNFGFVNPPPELIELKRVQLKIRRYLNQGEQT